jgi:cobalt/nickel transport protein
MKPLVRIVFCLMICLVCSVVVLSAEEKWKGIDETVVGRIAREHGREVSKSLIDTGEGDLQLFVFLAAGVVGGFVAGYCWRMLLEGKKKPGRRDDAS